MPGPGDIPHQLLDVDTTMPSAPPEEPIDDTSTFLRVLLVQFERSNKRQEDLARQNHALLQELNNRNAHYAAPATRERKVKVNAPAPYDGTAKTFLDFLTSLHLVFGADPLTYATVQSRIYYALSYMTVGAAGRWAKNVVQDIQEGLKNWNTWKEFEDELRQHFEGETKKDDAQLELEELKQGSMTAENFFQTFESYSRDAEYNDEALIRLLKKNLHPRLLTSIYNQTPLPKKLKEWKEVAIQKDRQWRELKLNAASGSNRTNGGFNKATWGRTSGGVNDTKGATTPKTGSEGHHTASSHGGAPTHSTGNPASNATGVFGGAGIPMELDRTRGGTMGKFQCYNCSGEGHLARNCPKPRSRPQRSTVRAIIQAMSEEERRDLLNELGFQNDEE